MFECNNIIIKCILLNNNNDYNYIAFILIILVDKRCIKSITIIAVGGGYDWVGDRSAGKII